MSYFPGPDQGLAEHQHAVLLGMLADWDRESPGSQVLQDLVAKTGKIQDGNSVHSALRLVFPSSDHIRLANRICAAWFVRKDLEEVDQLMSDLVTTHVEHSNK